MGRRRPVGRMIDDVQIPIRVLVAKVESRDASPRLGPMGRVESQGCWSGEASHGVARICSLPTTEYFACNYTVAQAKSWLIGPNLSPPLAPGKTPAGGAHGVSGAGRQLCRYLCTALHIRLDICVVLHMPNEQSLPASSQVSSTQLCTTTVLTASYEVNGYMISWVARFPRRLECILLWLSPSVENLGLKMLRVRVVAGGPR